MSGARNNPSLHRTALILAIVFGCAHAGDARHVDIGSPCKDIPAREAALRSKQLESKQLSDAEVLNFHGRAFDQNATLTYACVNHVLRAGSVYLPVQSFADVVANFEALHALLTKTFGVPYTDNSPWMPPTWDKRFIEADSRKYMTTWSSSLVSVTAMIFPSQSDEPEGLRVILVYSQPLRAAQSESASEPVRER